MDIDTFEKLPVMGIARGIDKKMLGPLADCCASAGLPAIEITMNTPAACSLIEELSELAGGRFSVGAGTVTSGRLLAGALAAGAQFIVSPVACKTVIEGSIKAGKPVFPGALTPSEIYCAWEMGASMVKVFPARNMGPAYFEDIAGPFPHIKLLACGGVGAANAAAYMKAGAAAIAFGSSIFNIDWMNAGRYGAIKEHIEALIAIAAAYKAAK
jgi:2-dehydro-3-deoxyphosphogluconate aldolase / (4S)-4-hydroxy-2-oxoglutarate aldolase